MPSMYCWGDWEPVRNSTGRSPRDLASFTPLKLACHGASASFQKSMPPAAHAEVMAPLQRASLKLVTNAKRPDLVRPSHVPPCLLCKSRPANRSLWSSQKRAVCVGLHPQLAFRSAPMTRIRMRFLLQQASTCQGTRRG